MSQDSVLLPEMPLLIEGPQNLLFEPPFEPWYTHEPSLLREWLCNECEGVEVPHAGPAITSIVIQLPRFGLRLGLRRLSNVSGVYPAVDIFAFNLPLSVPEALFREGVKWFTSRGCVERGGPSQNLATLMVPHPKTYGAHIASIKLTTPLSIKQ